MSIVLEQKLLIAPSSVAPTSMTYAGSAWANSAWVETIASTSAPIAVVGIVLGFSTATAPFNAEVDLGTGSGGNEVAIGTLRVTTNEAITNRGPSFYPFLIPITGIGSSTRVSLRVRSRATFSALRIAIVYADNYDGDAGTTATLSAAPAAATNLTLTPNASAWADSASVELITTTTEPIVWAGFSFAKGVDAVDFEMDLLLGAGETVATTLRGYIPAGGAGSICYLMLPAGYPIGAGQRVAVKMRKTGTDTTAWTVAGMYYGPLNPTAPVDYEDPCEIVLPREFWVIETEAGTIKTSVTPLRHTAEQGGFATPRVLDRGPIVKAGSDPSSGAITAQTATLGQADTDYVLRTATATRTSLRGCQATAYLTSKAQSDAGGPPRVLLTGSIYADSADPNLAHGLQINDTIGSRLTVSGDEKPAAERVTAVTHFPSCPQESLGRTEPPRVGRFAPLDPTQGEGVAVGLHVGRIAFGSAPGTPTGTDLAAIVSALNTAGAAGTIKADYGGSRIGFNDADVLQAYYDDNGTVPTDYDGLANIIGYSDLDPWLNLQAATGGTEKIAVLFAAHAVTEFLAASNGDASLWIDDTQLDPAERGVSWWAPRITGDTSWATLVGGSDQFTDIVGTDGVTRRYTLVLFEPGSTYGDLVEAGGRVHADFVGAAVNPDGSGGAITEYFAGYLWLLQNVLLQTYYTGDYLVSPTFLFSDGIRELSEIDEDSFTTAADVWALTVPTGLECRFTIGDGESERDVIERLNFNGGCVQGYDEYGRYFVKVLDRRRSQFFLAPDGSTHRTIKHKKDILEGFKCEPKPDWQCNLLRFSYSKNEYTGDWERPAGAGGAAPIQDLASQARHGQIPKSVEYPFLYGDTSTAAVAQAHVNLFGRMPFVASYARRGLCGLEDGVWQGVPITHFNGLGDGGFVDAGFWVWTRSYEKEMYCRYQAILVDHLLDAEDEPLPRVVADYPVNAAILIDADTGFVLVNGA